MRAHSFTNEAAINNYSFFGKTTNSMARLMTCWQEKITCWYPSTCELKQLTKYITAYSLTAVNLPNNVMLHVQKHIKNHFNLPYVPSKLNDLEQAATKNIIFFGLAVLYVVELSEKMVHANIKKTKLDGTCLYSWMGCKTAMRSVLVWSEQNLKYNNFIKT